MTARPFTVLLPLLLPLLLLGPGCGGQAPAPTLFILQAMPAATAPVAARPAGKPGAARQITVALGPVSVPDYLDRTDFVRRASDNRLKVSETERWAETVRAGLLRVLAADLSARLGSGWWVTTTGERGTGIDIELPVDVEAFEADATGRVVLTASWEIRPAHPAAGADDRPTIRKRTSYARTAGIDDVEGQIRALSDNLTDLSADLATSLARVRP
jgi:hypothetical protein